MSQSQRILIVTGYSGAGKTTVLKALEDIGFFCVDNLPLALLPAFFEHVAHGSQQIALGLDIRSGTSLEKIQGAQILFLSATTPELVKRFQETRRRHPLANQMSLVDAIEHEKQLLQPIANHAELVVDTGNFTVHQLRNFVRTTFAQQESQPLMVVSLISFGFRYGTPQECNYVYDVRSLPNPYFVPELRNKTGLDPEIREYLFAQPAAQEYWRRLSDFFLFTLQKSMEEGRSFIHVAVGCTAGQHRSVAFVEELAKLAVPGVTYTKQHKGLAREDGKKDVTESILRI